MLPNQSNNAVYGQSTAGHFPDQSWVSQISVASKAELATLLRTKCMKVSQLQAIKNRSGIQWGPRELFRITYRIAMLTERGLEQESEILSLFPQGDRQYTDINAERDVRSVATQPPLVSTIQSADRRAEESELQAFYGQGGSLTQTLSEANPDQSSACAARMDSHEPVIIDAASILPQPRQTLPQWALDLIANICNKSEKMIHDEIYFGNFEAIYNLLDYQPMRLEHLEAILNRAQKFRLNGQRIRTLEKRIACVNAGAVETSTPFLRFRYYTLIENGANLEEFNNLLMSFAGSIQNNHHSYGGSGVCNDDSIPQFILDESRRVFDEEQESRIFSSRNSEKEYRATLAVSCSEFWKNELTNALAEREEKKNKEACQTVLDTERYIQETPENSAERSDAYQSETTEFERITEETKKENEGSEEKIKCIVCSKENRKKVNVANVMYAHKKGVCVGGAQNRLIHCEDHALKESDECPLCRDKIQFVMRVYFLESLKPLGNLQ